MPAENTPMSIFDKLFRPNAPQTNTGQVPNPQIRADNAAFLAAMNNVARGDSPETRQALYEAMQKAWFLVPQSDAASAAVAPGKHTSDGSMRISLPILNDGKGVKVLPTFTDEEALAHWRHEPTPYIALQGASFFKIVVQSDTEDIAVNPPPPGKPPVRAGGRITRDEFRTLAEGLIPHSSAPGVPARLQVQKDQKCLLSMPKQMPRQELFDALASAARTQPNVLALYFCQISFGQGAPHGAILIELLPGTSQMFSDKIIDGLGSAISPLLSQQDSFDFFPSTVGGLADAIKRVGARIYAASRH
jgi:hypothetical protein